jgi:hypothetical protein
MVDKMPGRAANCFQYPGGDLSRPANPQARLSAAQGRMQNEECRMPDPGKDLVGQAMQAADAVKDIIAADDRLAVVAAE